MKTTIGSFILFLFVLIGVGCTGNSSQASKAIDPSIKGTWQLLTVLAIEGEDSVLTDYTQGVKGIKMLNDTHFAFFQHDLNQGEDTAIYVSGGGPYSFVDGIYPEHREALYRLRAALDTWIAETGDQGEWLEPEEIVIPFEKEMHDWFGTPEWYNKEAK